MTLAEKSNSHLQKEEAACWVNNFECAIKSLNHAVKVFQCTNTLVQHGCYILVFCFFVAVVVVVFFKSALVALFLTLLCGKQVFYFEQGKTGY